MDKAEKISLIVLLVLALTLSGLLIYNRKELSQTVSESMDPFVSDRVAHIRIVMNNDDWQQMKTNAMAEQYVRADFWFDGEPFKNVAVRPKGMSSLMSSAGSGTGRVSLKVDFNFFNFAQTFHGLKKLNLNNGFSDPTLIRETLGYELFEQMDIPTPRTAFVDVWINDIHLGLYTMVEQVDKTFLRRHFNDPDGNLYKPESAAAALNWTKDDLDKQSIEPSRTSEQKEINNLDIKVGGARLGDLVMVLRREGVIGSDILPEDTAASSQRGPFGGGPGGPGGRFQGGPEGMFPGNPGEQFPGGRRGRFPGGQESGFPGDPNRPFPGGFPGLPRDPNGPFERGIRDTFPGGSGGRFADDPNSPFAGRRGRRGFGGGPGGPGGPSGRGGNLLEQMGLKTNENFPDHSALLKLLEVLNKCPDETFPTEIEKVLDVDGVLRFLAVSVIMVHLDNYIGMGHNYYLYEVDGKFTIIPWDLNMAFGTFGGGGRGTSSSDFYIDEPVTSALSERPLVARLLAHKPYMDKYHRYLEQLLQGGFAEGVMEARIDELVNLIRPYVEADELKFFSTDDFEKSINEDLNSSGRGGFFPGRGPMQRDRNQEAGNATEFDPEQMDRMPGGFENGPGPRQGRMGPGGGRDGGRRGGGGPGMNAPGLKSFIKQRRISVREQLDGKRPGKSEGGQDTGRFNMFDRFGGGRGGPF